MRSLSTLMSWSDMSLKGPLGDPACQKIGRLRWPFSLLSPPAGLMVGGVESECVRRVSPDKRLEAQADKFLELCEIIGWTRELHAAGRIALKQLESVREMAKVTKRQRSRRRKQGCRCVRESMSLPGDRCRIEGACKARGEERRTGVQVCLVELVDTGLPEVLPVSVTWKRARVERCRCRLCRAEDENGSASRGRIQTA
jgi:hypothetical protein